MVSKDALVVIAGIVIIAIALIGVFTYEDEYQEDSEDWERYAIQWMEATRELTSETGTLFESDPVTLSETLDVRNVTEIRFMVSWNDDFTGRLRNFTDIFTMTVSEPGGAQVEYYAENPASSGDSPLIITGFLGEKPDAIQVNSTDDSHVREILQENTTENGMGGWTVTLDVDIKKPLWKVLRNRGDEYMVTITYKYYWAEVTLTDSS